MKLRQKLALALATAMIVTAMPAMAASDNKISHMPVVGKDALVGFDTTTVAADGTVLPTNETVIAGGIGNVPMLNIDYSDSSVLPNGKKDSFILQLTDGEFKNVYKSYSATASEKVYDGKWQVIPGSGTQGVTDCAWMRLTPQSDSKQLLVEVFAGGTAAPTSAVKYSSTTGLDAFDVPLFVKATGSTPTVEIISDSGRVTTGKVIVGTAATTNARGQVTVADAEKFYEKGKLAKITVMESYVGAFRTSTEDNLLKLSLEHEDFSYELQDGDKVGSITRGANVDIYVGPSKGASVKDKDGITRTASAWLDSKNKDILWVAVPKNLGTSATQQVRYAVELDNLKVTARKPDLGDFNVTVGGDLVDETTVKAGVVVEFGIKLSVKDDKVKEVKAGRSEKATVIFEEIIEDSMTPNRSVEFKLTNGKFLKGIKSIADEGTSSEKITYADKTSEIDKSLTLKIFKRDYLKKITINDDSDLDKNVAIPSLVYTGKDVTGFEFVPDRATKTALRTDKKDKITFEDLKVNIDLGDREKENAKLTVSGSRMFGEDITIDVLKIINPIKVEFTGLTAKVGLKKQDFPDAKLVLTETEKGVFSRGKELTIDIDDEDGIKFAADPVVTVKQGTAKLVEKDDFTITKSTGTITITIKRASTEPTTIEMTGIKLDLDRTVPEGTYDLKVKGEAIADINCGDLTVKDFIKIGTPNTEDITTDGLRKGISSFTIGSKKYVVNEKEFEMDAAPYIQGSSTMLPIRYVSSAFGVAEKDILFSAGSATIIAKNRTIQLTNGKEVAKLNGADVKMAQKAVIKDGRMYVPVGEVARLLGIKVDWDNATKTAKFINE